MLAPENMECGESWARGEHEALSYSPMLMLLPQWLGVGHVFNCAHWGWHIRLWGSHKAVVLIQLGCSQGGEHCNKDACTSQGPRNPPVLLGGGGTRGWHTPVAVATHTCSEGITIFHPVLTLSPTHPGKAGRRHSAHAFSQSGISETC